MVESGGRNRSRNSCGTWLSDLLLMAGSTCFSSSFFFLFFFSVAEERVLVGVRKYIQQTFRDKDPPQSRGGTQEATI